MLRAPLIAQMENLISAAYEGQGVVWLADLMENKDRIPLSGYLDKANRLYVYAQNVFILISSFFLFTSLAVVGIQSIYLFIQKKLSFISNNRKIILEVLAVAPLLLAFGMWMRVALATPIKSPGYFQILPPQIIDAKSMQEVELKNLSTSPTSLSFEIAIEEHPIMLSFSGISFTDSRFLRISEGNADFVNVDSALGLRINKAGLITLITKHEVTWVPLLVTGVAWVSALAVLFNQSKRISHNEKDILVEKRD